MIDGRQYRSVPPCGWGEAQACEAAYDPAITMLGAQQEQWLYAGLSSATRWNAFGNNVMIARLDHDGAAGDLLWNDAWDGFPAARNRLLDQVVARDVRNAVFVTGDWHSTFVNHVKQDFDAPDSPVVASEFVGTSVTTNGDGIVYGPYYGPMIAVQPAHQVLRRRPSRLPAPHADRRRLAHRPRDGRPGRYADLAGVRARVVGGP